MSGVHPPISAIREAVTRALAEDLEPMGDITSALLPEGHLARAVIVARAEGVLAGRRSAEEVFRQVDGELHVEWAADDGYDLAPDQQVATVVGPLAPMLAAERTALNFLCHLSGVATLTRRFVRATHGRCRVWDTRKTTPGLRALEKAAVRAGGGLNHRGNLSEWVLLKDNHLAQLGIEAGVQRARVWWPARPVQVEIDRVEQLQEAMASGADLILLDNMTPEDVRRCVEGRGDSSHPLLEASGRMNLSNVGAYAATGVDLVSVGALTSSAPALDLALDIIQA